MVDFKASLAINQSLFPEEHESVAAAHYKLSLALEFASITRAKEDGDEPADGEEETQLDQVMRDEAAAEMEAAIKSVQIKLHNKEVELASTFSPDDNEVIIDQIKDAKEIIAEMEQRVSSLFHTRPECITDSYTLAYRPQSSCYRQCQGCLVWTGQWGKSSRWHPGYNLRGVTR